jgi:hypothetical protein
LISSGVVLKKNVSLWPVARSKFGPSSRIGPVIPPPARIVSSAACMSTFDNEVSAKASIEAKVKEDICMIVPGLNVVPYSVSSRSGWTGFLSSASRIKSDLRGQAYK